MPKLPSAPKSVMREAILTLLRYGREISTEKITYTNQMGIQIDVQTNLPFSTKIPYHVHAWGYYKFDKQAEVWRATHKLITLLNKRGG